MESQGIKSQKKHIKALKKKKKKCVASELFLLLLPGPVWFVIAALSSFCICAFFHSSPWLCTE